MHRALGPKASVAGILLTGGSSRRMGFDKSTMRIGGVRCAVRIAEAMQAVVGVAVEVGPGASGLTAVQEEQPGGGPLAAVCEGLRELTLSQAGAFRSVLILACDLPLITETVLRTIAQWPGNNSLVPIVEGRPQPLCARWSLEDLAAVPVLVARGNRSMRSLLDSSLVELVDEVSWPEAVDRRAFFDVDTPGDIERLGLILDPTDQSS